MENGLAGIWGEEIAGAGEYLRAGEIPGRSTGDPGRVPLSFRATAKGGERGTQLASLRQVFLVLQRSHPRAWRNQLPGSCAPARKLTAVGWREMINAEGSKGMETL